MIQGYGMKCRKQRIKSAIFFGLGLLVATVLPDKWTLVAAAVALVVVSLSCIRR
ncbi:MAG: hypothetical protein IIU98_00015 [Ruminococcus sp.]|nr:hypothetical protein [Ruminococcus sp.]